MEDREWVKRLQREALLDFADEGAEHAEIAAFELLRRARLKEERRQERLAQEAGLDAPPIADAV